MNIEFGNETIKTACQLQWNNLDAEERLTFSHFELAANTSIQDTEAWIAFLKDPRVMDKIEEELMIYKQSQQRKLIQKATSHDRSVGTAQMISALGKTLESASNTGGQIFVYSYVPPNAKEMDADNVFSEKEDIFEKR